MDRSTEKKSRRNRLFDAVGRKSVLNKPPNLKINRTEYVNHPNLPIIAPDFSFVMDLFDMDTLQMQEASIYHGDDRVKEVREDEENVNADKVDKNGKDVKEEKYVEDESDPDEHEHERLPNRLVNKKRTHGTDHGYRYLLVLIDTTSRKVWMYPTKTKSADEVKKAFDQFVSDVHGKISRLLSDSDSAFANIEKNNKYFTYVQVVASHGNHTTLSRIDSFAKTFRQMLYYYYADFVRDGSGKDFSWYDSYELIRDTYNDTKHRALRLVDTRKIKRDERRSGQKSEFTNADGKVSLHKCNDPNKKEDVWHKYYTPNQVWYNAKLRSRIRLQYYLSKRSNYDKIYKKIANAEYVRVRVLNDKINKGYKRGYFSNAVYRKGKKRGNSWVVNGRYVTYRNILPVGSKEDVEAFEKPRETKLTRGMTRKLQQYLLHYKYDPSINANANAEKTHLITAAKKRKRKEVAELHENAKDIQPKNKKRTRKPNSRYFNDDYEN